MSSKTWMEKPGHVKRSWLMVSAEGRSLGRLASSVAGILAGKHKPSFTPHVMGGDFVVVTHADKIRLTGKKWAQKMYYRHSRFVGSLKEKKAGDMPKTELIRLAVRGMLPKNKHRPRALKRLKIFKGAEHTYKDKSPQALKL